VKAAAHLSLLPTGRAGKTETATAFSDEVGAPVAVVVLRRGGKEEGAQVQVYPKKKAARGVLRALLIVEWVTTVEEAEVPAIGRLLAVSSCTDGERAVRGGNRFWSKTRWHGDTRKASVRWPYRRRSGARPSGEAHSDSGDSGTWTRAVGRRSDSEVAARLRTTKMAWLRTKARSADAFMARARRVAVSARHGVWHARWRQCADERTRRREREADRWDPAADFIPN
jgi:hypothetical protein